MIVPEASLARLAEVVSQFLDGENLAGFLLNDLGPVRPDQFKTLPTRRTTSSVWSGSSVMMPSLSSGGDIVRARELRAFQVTSLKVH